MRRIGCDESNSAQVQRGAYDRETLRQNLISVWLNNGAASELNEMDSVERHRNAGDEKNANVKFLLRIFYKEGPL